MQRKARATIHALATRGHGFDRISLAHENRSHDGSARVSDSHRFSDFLPVWQVVAADGWKGAEVCPKCHLARAVGGGCECS